MLACAAAILLLGTISTAYGLVDPDLLDFDTIPYFEPPESSIIHFDDQLWRAGGEHKRYIVFGSDSGERLWSVGGTTHLIPTGSGFISVGTFSQDARAKIEAMGYHIVEDIRLEFDAYAGDASRIGEITGARQIADTYGYRGAGVTVGIVDTGVDFSNTDIRHALARDDLNRPIMLDADGQGIVLTNTTFVANIDEHGMMRSYDGELPENATSRVYVDDDGVFLDINQDGAGTIIHVYSGLYPINAYPVLEGVMTNDMRIGTDRSNYIVSKSGVYHLGILLQPQIVSGVLTAHVVPVLVTDSAEAGVYDTITPDLSTAWAGYTSFDPEEGSLDFDFTDEREIQIGEGNEFLVYDSDGDGRDNYSAGVVGARVLDVHGVISSAPPPFHDTLGAVNGTLLPPMDPGGNFFGVMTDFLGHGSSSAATIASSGQREYDIYGTEDRFTITGIAPAAKILPVKALWFGDIFYTWMWAAGFDHDGHAWTYSDQTRADILSNSWGVPKFPNIGMAPGVDILSILSNTLSVPGSMDQNYPGMMMVFSSGNDGPGYGTMGLPVTSFGVMVGATTNNVFVGHGGYDEQPRFGSTTVHRNHIVDFSSRGPTIIGDPKPDLVATGAYAFVPFPVTETTGEPTNNPVSLYGGTSMAAPMVAGSAAVLIEALRANGVDPDPFLVKNILLSTATDLGNDPLVQGAGLVNVTEAVDYVRGDMGRFIVYNDASYGNVIRALDASAQAINHTAFGLEQFIPPAGDVPVTSWFAGRMEAGQRSTATFTIESSSPAPMDVTIAPQSLQLIKRTEYHGTTVPHQQDPILNGTDTFVPNYIRLSDIREFKTLSDYYDYRYPVPADASLMILSLAFDFDSFMNDTDTVYADDLKIASLYLYDWNDSNGDSEISSDELSLVSRAGSWGTVQELRISDPNSKFQHEPVVGVYPVPIRLSYWMGETARNTTAIDYSLSASYYDWREWDAVWIGERTVTVPAGGTADVLATVLASDLSNGVHQGVITFESSHADVQAPVSFVVRDAVEAADGIIFINGTVSDSVAYGNGYVKGSFDMFSNYMTGDWRHNYFEIKDASIDTGVIRLSWEDGDTSLSVFAVDPQGRVIQANAPPGVFGYLSDWPSNDWLGANALGSGGGFYHVGGGNSTSTQMQIPINQTGTYSIMIHSTLFGGRENTEPFSIVARFLDMDLR